MQVYKDKFENLDEMYNSLWEKMYQLTLVDTESWNREISLEEKKKLSEPNYQKTLGRYNCFQKGNLCKHLLMKGLANTILKRKAKGLPDSAPKC